MKTVFILCDTLRYDHVTPEIMPNLHKMSQEGINYTMFFGDGGHTKWSMPHFLSGQRNYDLENSFPKTLTEHKIENKIVHSNAVLVREKYQECFKEYVDMGMEKDPVKTGLRRQLKDVGLWHKTRPLRRAIRGKKNFNVPYRRAESILDIAQGKLDEIQDGFLWVQLMDPHIPYSPPELGNVEQTEAIKLYDLVLKSLREGHKLKPIEVKRLEQLYAMECTYMDKCIKEFVENNKECLFFISSDHGDMFGENYTFSHSPGPHGVTPQLGHLPMIIYGPEVPSKTYTGYNCSINVGTTILDLYGIDEVCGYGRSFLKDIFQKE
ncbi:sulfatase-like hydrolase/transferase [Candidatus Bathyarchaeota archaeon]|nr:sulfatase-like hydrolase/transferase [Candidatus Bathyarchaeota archaeon]